MHDTIVMLGAIGAVILIAALTSGLMERSHLPQVLVFLLVGAAAGPAGLGLFDYAITSGTVQVVAVLGLVLVLFTDAVGVHWVELRRHLRLAAVVLGPGTTLTALVVGASAYWLLDLGAAQSAILGAALASTDPVLLRGVLRSPATPPAARQALRIESGMNDAILLPAILVASALLLHDPEGTSLTTVVLRTLLVGGGVGALVGFISVRAMEVVRRHIGMRRDYESLYVLAIALTAFAVAEASHGSGFIAAFAAGLTIAALDTELCECFYDYGEASAEMALLFAFVILGTSAIWSGLEVVSVRTLAFSAVALFARGVVLAPALLFVDVDRRSRWLVLWHGPRGLSSLLLVLLPVFAGVPDAPLLFAITSLVVLLSIVVHGGSQMLLRAPASVTPPSPSGADAESVPDPVRVTVEEVARLQAAGETVAVLDGRSDASYRRTRAHPAGALRISPERAVDDVRTLGLPPDTWLVIYCT